MECVKRLAALCVCLACSIAGSQAIILGQIDDFQDGTLMGWGGGANPVNVADGGPLGIGDRYLEITSDGGGMGGKLATTNPFQWSGDYLAVGVTRVDVDIRNQSELPLSMRICLIGVNTDRWTSTAASMVAVNGGWTRVSFDLRETALTRVRGAGSYTDALSNVLLVLIRHDAGNPSSGGTNIVGQMGIDNVRAVPEPSTLAVLLIGAATLRSRLRR